LLTFTVLRMTTHGIPQVRFVEARDAAGARRKVKRDSTTAVVLSVELVLR
jgi:hypothetical protein